MVRGWDGLPAAGHPPFLAVNRSRFAGRLPSLWVAAVTESACANRTDSSSSDEARRRLRVRSGAIFEVATCSAIDEEAFSF